MSMLLALAGTMNPAQGASEPVLQLDLAAQPLGDSLRDLAAASNTNIAFDPLLVSGMQAPALRGSLTAQQALDRLLAGTKLQARFVDAQTVTVVPDKISMRAPEPALTKVASAEQTARRARPAETSTTSVEEIVVTATKRSELLSDVPVSIAVVTSSEIAARGLVSAEDYLRGLPGANQVDSNFGPAVTIRGLETSTTSQNLASGSTVAMYFGETSTTSSTGITGGSGADLKLVDIERVEVLRGPQGTAFGNSALGGVIRTIPRAPKLDGFEGNARVGASVTSGNGGENHMLQAVANIPLITDRLAIRAVGYQFEDSGFYRNVAPSDPLLQARAATLKVPAALLTSHDEVGGSTFTGGRIAALFQATDRLKFTLTYVNQDTEVDAWAGSNRSGYDQAIYRVGPAERVFGLTRGGNETQVELSNAVMEYDLGWGSLLATFSHIDGESQYAYPWSVSATAPVPLASATRSTHSENSGEIRLATSFEGPVNFLVGVYGEELDDLWTQTVYWNADLATISVAYPFLSAVPIAAPGILNDSRNYLQLGQRAAFGEVSWQLVPKLTLTGGVRAYRFDRDTKTLEYGALTSPAAADVLRTTVGHTDASGTTFRGNVKYEFTDDALVYAGWSEGFRLGKPQSGLPAGACDVNADGLVDGTNVSIASTREIQSDDVESVEIGAKLSFAERRVSISADIFRAEWNEIPVQVRATCAGGTIIGYTANATSAISEGIEGQVRFQVTPALRLDVGGSYIDATLSENALGLTPPAFKGNRLPSPKVNASLAAQYDFALGGYEAYVRTDSTYVDSFNSRLPPAPANTSDSYVKVDAATGISINAFSIDLYVRNLTNRDAITFAPAPYPALRLRPRTYGVQMGYQF